VTASKEKKKPRKGGSLRNYQTRGWRFPPGRHFVSTRLPASNSATQNWTTGLLRGLGACVHFSGDVTRQKEAHGFYELCGKAQKMLAL